MEVNLKEDERIDDLEYKGLKIIQNKKWFCFGIDSVLLSDFAKEIKDAGLGVLCFTGDLVENLRLNDKNRLLLENTDLLIDGAFEVDKVDYSRPWCGSSNQRYHFLTNRYNDELFTKYKNKVEVNISKSGVVSMNGMGNFEEIAKKILK